MSERAKTSRKFVICGHSALEMARVPVLCAEAKRKADPRDEIGPISFRYHPFLSIFSTATDRFLREINVAVWFPCTIHDFASLVGLLAIGCRPIRDALLIRSNLIGHNLAGPVF